MAAELAAKVGWLRRIQTAVQRDYPTLWVLHAHVVVPLVVLYGAVVLIGVMWIPIDKASGLFEAAFTIGLLYMVSFVALAVYGVAVIRRVGLLVEVICTPARVVVGATLFGAAIVGVPMLALEADLVRMDREYEWSSGKLCRDVQVVERVLSECMVLGKKTRYREFNKKQMPSYVRDLIASRNNYDKTMRYLEGSRELVVFEACRRRRIPGGFGGWLSEYLEICKAYGGCPQITEIREDTATLQWPTERVCALFAGSSGQFGFNSLHQRIVKVQQRASRGPWALRSFEQILWLSVALWAAGIFAQLATTAVGRRRVALTLVVGATGALCYDIALPVGIPESYRIRLAIGFLLVYGGSLAGAVTRLRRVAGDLALLAVALSPFAATIAAWLYLRWQAPGTIRQTFTDIFTSVGEFVEFPKLAEPPDPFINWQLPRLLGVAGVALCLLTAALVMGVARRARAEPR